MSALPPGIAAPMLPRCLAIVADGAERIGNFELFPLMRRRAEATAVGWNGTTLALLHLEQPSKPTRERETRPPSEVSWSFFPGCGCLFLDRSPIAMGAPLLALAAYLALFTPSWLAL